MSNGLRRLVLRAVKVEEREVAGLLWSTAYFFFLLASYFVLRPVRDTFGIDRGPEVLPYLWIGTFCTTLLLTPVFAWVIARYPRRRFIPVVYHFFTLNILIFFALLVSLGDDGRVAAGYVFYVWLSAFNAFAVAVFWGFMVDLWGTEQGKRLFGFVAAGGTLGALAGSGVTLLLAKPLTNQFLMLLAAGGLQATVFCVHRLVRCFAVDSGTPPPRRRVSLSETFAGIRHVARSPYLAGIALYLVLDTLTATFLYYQQGNIVYSQIPDREQRTAFFALLNFGYNGLTLFIEILFTSRIIGTLGVAATLMVLPLVNLAGFTVIAMAPTLAVLGTFQILRKTTKYSITKPAREVLFTVLSREDKYKAKSFVDTAILRGSDMVWIWSASTLKQVSKIPAILSLVVVPMTLLWMVVGLALGRAQKRRSNAIDAVARFGA